MGGVVDGGAGIGVKTSPRRAAIEKAQAELRQEYDVREERRRELEFLEKGGNPLDFKFGNVASLSLQSTSLAERNPEQLHSSEAKGSFALAASPHGDSVESSGRPGPASVSGRKSTDNPVLFDGENEMLEGEKNSLHLGRKNNITSSEQSSQLDGTRNAKESEDSAIFRPYARRNRTRTNRDGARLGSAEGVHNRGGQGSSLASRASVRDTKGSSTETNSQKEKLKVVGVNGDMVSRTATPESRLDGQIDGEQALVSTTSLKQSDSSTDKLDITIEGSKDNNWQKQPFDDQKASDLASQGPDLVPNGEGTVLVGNDDLLSLNKGKEIDTSDKLNGSNEFKGDNKINGGDTQKCREAFDRKDSEPSIYPSIGMDAKDNVCNDAVKIISNGNTVVQLSESEKDQKLTGCEMIDQQDFNKTVDSSIIAGNGNHIDQQNHAGIGVVSEGIEDTSSRSDPPIKANDTSVACEDANKGQIRTETEEERKNDHNSNLDRDNTCNMRPPVDPSSCGTPSTSFSGIQQRAAPNCQTSINNLRKVDKAYEDSVLAEARIIQAKRKRIAELSGRTSASENRPRCHWNSVLDEMAWLANDFAQERLWKMTAAAQLSHRVAFMSRYRCEEQSQRGKLKVIAHNLAKAVMQFWHTAEVLLNGNEPILGLEARQSESVGLQRNSGGEATNNKSEDPTMESRENSMLQSPDGSKKLPIQAYAVRFLRNSDSGVSQSQAEAPRTPDIISDVDMPEVSWDDHFTEESLFYTIPPGAMETYRKSIEAYVTECERTGSNVQEEVGTSIFSTVAEQVYQDYAYDEDEAETSAYILPGAEGSKSSKFAQKKRKNPRLYDQGADVPYGHYATGAQPSALVDKRPANLSVGPIPAKRMRTANVSRQRVLSPFGTGAHGNIQAQAKTEVSSGDTNSFQDDQNSLLGGSRIQKGFEVESAGEFEKHVSYDYAETSTKPKKKKKKAKNMDSTFDPAWQLGSTALSEQREQSKKRSEHFDSNGTSGLYGQHNAKKPKMMKLSLDNNYDNIMSMSGSIPCPTASQMSNMSNQNKLMRYIGGRDKNRKAKALKASSLHSGPGSHWSLFEDQALVVLVHDMGPNWELVSDAINSTLQFKCIFRKPKECKDRHKILMDKSAGDGADSAEDSGSSQSYPSTLPGIPKGSARQLFQRLQGPVEEDTLKEHFDKIIQIAQRQHHWRIQMKNESQDVKQMQVHNSHFVALSQVCPNNLNGVVLTPLDLIEATASSPDVLPLNYQGSHSSNPAMPNQGGAVSSVLAASGVNPPLPGSPGFVLGNNMPPAGPFNSSMRDGRYNVPKTSPAQGDEQQRMQPYNQMLSNNSMPQSNLPVPGSSRGVRVLPGGNGLGMNRATGTMPIARPGYPGMASSPMLNSTNMLSSPMVGAQSPANMPLAGSGPTQGRSRESMHLPRGGHNGEQQRQIPAQELPMHVSQGNAQGVPSFNGMGTAFSNQTTAPVQAYPGHSQQPQHQLPQQPSHASNNPHHHSQLQGANHGTGPQQQQMLLRLAKERQMQQQRYLQQQQQFASSNNLLAHVQSSPQLPMSSPLNNPHFQSQSPSQSASLPPLTPSSPITPMASQQHHPKNQLPPHSHGHPRIPQTTVGGLSNQVGAKQRQRQAQQQQLQQSGRAHPQQRPQVQPQQQQAKYVKGIGRGNMPVHQKLPADPSHLNGISAAPGSIGVEKEMMQQGQGLYQGTGVNPVQSSKAPIAQAPNHSPLPAGPAAPHSTKQHPQQPVPSHSENSLQGQLSAIPPGHNMSSAQHQAVPSTLMKPHMGQLQSQPHQNQSQAQTVAQRMHPQNRQHMNYDQLQVKSQANKAQAADQKLINTTAPQAGIGSAATPAAATSVDSPSKAGMAASPSIPLQRASEAAVPIASTPVGAIGSPTLASSTRSEQLPTAGQGGHGQRQLDNAPPHGIAGGGAHGAVARQPSRPLPPSSQQQYLPQPQEPRDQAPSQLLPQSQSQPQQQPQPQPQSQSQPQPQPPQSQHLQAAQASLYIGPTNS